MSAYFGLTAYEQSYSIIDPIAITGIITSMEYDARVFSDAGVSAAGVGDTVTRWYYRNDISKWANQAFAGSKPILRSGYIETGVGKAMDITSIALSTGAWSAYFCLNTLPYAVTAAEFRVFNNSTTSSHIGVQSIINTGVYTTSAITRADSGVATSLTVATTQLTTPVVLKITRNSTTLSAKITGNSLVSTSIAGDSTYTVNEILAALNVTQGIKRILLYNKILTNDEEVGLAGYFLSKDGAVL